ncbi:hypothetical protein [Vibrio sp. TRT 29B02]|uniref:hypothetical protein n=1 Tax=Vibrio sp. TRT 29B02 TaxID=3418508 RepID=UPI003CF57BA3
MYSAIQDSELYQERIKKDIILSLVTQYPAGQVVQAEDILELDKLGSRPQRETLEKIMVPVIEGLKEKHINYTANKMKKVESPAQNELAAAPAHKINVLF